MKDWWKYSKLRFYYLNTLWNYNFWLKTTRVYETFVSSEKPNRLGETKSPTARKRFKGYLYKGNIYLDNPGIPNIPRDVWNAWKTKGLIK